MCLILFALDAHPRYRLVLAANRDELYERPTLPAAPWDDAPWIVAGRDLLGGGTWLGVTREGRWAAVTNYRDSSGPRHGAPSRGHLVGDFLRGTEAPEAYLRHLGPRLQEYQGFNLLVGDPGGAYWCSNRADGPPLRLQSGIHGLSNHLLNTPWPKVERGRRELARLLAVPNLEAEPLLDVLLDRTYAADHELPDTGVGPDLERALSAAFIATPEYGTRSSTVVLAERDGTLHLVERTYAPGSTEWTEARHRLRPEGR